MKALGLALAVTLGIAGAARPAQAALIDFTNATVWGGADGLITYSATYNGILDVTVTAIGGTLTFNAGDLNGSCGAVTGLSCQGDGLGITNDEVSSGAQVLFVEFSKPVEVKEIEFLDLFGYPNQSGDPQAEVARYTVYTPLPSPTYSVTGTDQTSNLGYQSTTTSHGNVSLISFNATVPVNSDFSLASVTAKVPEPSSFLLSTLGFAAVSAARSRRRS